MSTKISNIGDGTGYLYKVSGSDIIATYPNTTQGARQMLSQARVDGIIPVGVFTNDPTDLQDNSDPVYGHKYYINEAGDAAANDLTGATEITYQVVNRGLESNLPIESATIASGAAAPTRRACITSLVLDTEGGAGTDTLTDITEGEFVNGDIVIVRGTDSGRVITITDSGNIDLKDSEDFDTGNRMEVIILQLNKPSASPGAWEEVSRSLTVTDYTPTVASFRSNSIPQGIAGVKSVALSTSGQTVTLVPGTDEQVVRLTGTGTLSGNIVIQGGGTPLDGDLFIVKYNATFTLSGNSVTIFGETLSANEALQGKAVVIAVYDDSTAAYRTVLLMRWDDDIITENEIISSAIGNGLTGGSGTALAILPDTSSGTSLVVSAGGVRLSGDENTPDDLEVYSKQSGNKGWFTIGAALDAYDSGWQNFEVYDGSSVTSGLLNITNDPNRLQWRVVGNVVYFNGQLIIPLEAAATGLVADHDDYYDELSAAPNTSASGITMLTDNSIRFPTLFSEANLRPGKSTRFEDSQANRSIFAKSSSSILKLFSLVGVTFDTAGTLTIGVVMDSEITAVTGGTVSQVHDHLKRFLITKVAADDYALDWSGYKNSSDGSTTFHNDWAHGTLQYPFAVDGTDGDFLGGFRISMDHCFYIIDESVTLEQIKTAWTALIP